MKLIKSFLFRDFKSLDATEVGTFEGYLAAFGNVDHDGDEIHQKAFHESLKEWKGLGLLPAMLWNHDDDEPVGEYKSMIPDDVGVRVKGKIWIDRPHVTDATVKAYNVTTSQTGPKAMSVGFLNRKSSRAKDGHRLIEKGHIMEGSILQYGANDEAKILTAKGLVKSDGSVMDIREMEQFLRDGGLSIKQAKALLAQGYRGLQRDAESLVYDESELRRLKDSTDRLKTMMTDFNLSTKE